MRKIAIDIMITIVACICAYVSWISIDNTIIRQFLVIFLMGIAIVGAVDGILEYVNGKKQQNKELDSLSDNFIEQLLLLDEDGKPIRGWELAGKVSLIIGRENNYDDVDIDLQDSEYSALIDYQHAVLNYSNENWYIEDLNSKNGVSIQKVEDGTCYKIANDRPCKLSPGDVILIANTKLLIT